ncbi:MAG: hypothetical protein ABI193_16255, partial [Minicystis sp.]
MSEPAIVEMVFVELEAKDADCARRDVVEALGDLHLEGWCCEGALPDPERAGLFGVEVFAPPATLPDAGWDIAHALAAHLPRARAEAVLGVSLDEDEARGLSPQAPG